MVTLKCSNCDSVLTHSTRGDGIILVEPCSCRGDCPMCGGSGCDFDVRGHTRPCPCRSESRTSTNEGTGTTTG